MENSIFPLEIYENILQFADGFTLLKAELVCQEWKNIVERLTKKYNVWKYVCNNDMPKKVLDTMSGNSYCDKNEKWQVIFRNWNSWQNIKRYKLKFVRNSFEINSITCAKMSGNCIIYGTAKGIITIQDAALDFKDFIDVQTSIKDLYLMNPVKNIINEHKKFEHTHLLVILENAFSLFELGSQLREITSIPARSLMISIHEDYICYTDNFGFVNVIQVDFKAKSPDDAFKDITCFHIYEPIHIRKLCLFDKEIILASDVNIMTLSFNQSAPNWKIEPGEQIPFSTAELERYWIFYNEVFIAIGNGDFCLVSLNKDKKIENVLKFDWMLSLQSQICNIYYYGNILIITTNSGKVFFYVIKNWSNFNLENYDYSVYCSGKHICNIDIQERVNEHKLLVVMSDEIAQSTFLSLNNEFD